MTRIKGTSENTSGRKSNTLPGKLRLKKQTESENHIPLDDGVWLQKVKVKDLKPNSWNPNEMSKQIFSMLKDMIQERGFRQPILVRPNLVITDGEHRWQALKEQGVKETWVVVADEDELSAMVQTANMNLIKGEFNPIKYGTFLNTLLEKIPMDELSRQLPTPKVQIEALSQLVKDIPPINDQAFKDMASQQKWVIRLEFGNEGEYREAEGLLTTIMKLTGRTSHAGAVLELLRGFNNKPQTLKERL